MEDNKHQPNNKEFVLLSVEGYKKLAGTDASGKDLYWTTDINTEIPIKFKLQSDGRDILLPRTLPQVFQQNAILHGDDVSLHSEPTPGKWIQWTHRECWDISFNFAKSCIAYGISKRSACNIIGFNSPEWFLAFHGAIMADMISVGVYTTNGPEACQYVAEHSSAEIIVAEDEEQMEKYLSVLDQLPKLKIIVVYKVDTLKVRPTHIKAVTWKEFLEYGVHQDQAENGKFTEQVYERIADQVPGMCCDIVYTSGTTGHPKGVMLTHDNLIFVNSTFVNEFEEIGIEYGQERCVSYLPLSHSASQINDLMSNLVSRTQVYFARPDALSGTLVETLIYAKPTIFLAVPRIWEKMEERLKEIAASSPSLLRKVSNWAKSKGKLNSEAKMDNKDHPFGYSFAHFLILGRIKKALGLDEAKICVTGAAPMKSDTFEYFKSLDLPIINVYGMSENSGPETVQKPGKFKEYTAGYALPGTHIKISKRDKTEGGQENEGEICFRGRNNFIGYLNNEKETVKTLDNEGYIHSGDVGTKDAEGFIRITGRIKELIITAGGENVAPVLIEDSFKNHCPIVSNIMVIGDDKKYLSALITFKVDIDMSAGMGTPTKNLTITVKNFLEEELKVTGVNTTDEAAHNETIIKYLEKMIEENNTRSISRAQHVRKFRCLDTDFSIEGDELTPTMKLRRKVVVEKYSELIEEMYPREEKARL
jgi:long-chain-fatty-acid--CoA ligase ACSBG